MDHFDPTLISVVMPCYNAAPYVEEAIGCVLQQSYRNVELIVVDDGSNDASMQIVERLAAGNPGRITVLHQTNSGPYAARNHGLSHARGNFIAFLDADDTWHTDALKQLHAAMTETLADVAYCGWQNVGEAAASTQPYLPPDYVQSDAAALFLQSCPWPINGVLVRRQIIDTLRGFSERLPTAMDYDMWLRMLVLQPTVVRVPEVLAFYRRYPRGDAHIPRWRQVFDAIAVREDFVRRHPAQVAISAGPNVMTGCMARCCPRPIAVTGGAIPIPRGACSGARPARWTGRRAMPNTSWPVSCLHRYSNR